MEAQNSPNPFPRINQKKLESLQSGIDILELWIDNLVVNGIEQLSRDGSKIEEISTRMVDYGLSGIARKLRVIPEKLKLDAISNVLSAEMLALILNTSLLFSDNDFGVSISSAESSFTIITFLSIVP